MNKKEKPQAFLEKEVLTQKEAFDFFDQLEAVDIPFMIGSWKGQGLKTNHPMDGLLDSVNWFGKEFVDDETVFPLLFQKRTGDLFNVNPGRIPMIPLIFCLPKWLIKSVFPFLSLFIKTKKAKARLRMLEYKGKVSAAMIYDQHGIIDIFRKIDQNTVLGVMDMKGPFNKKSYFFILKRVT